MRFKETNLKGAWVIEMEKYGDDRGFFGRSWCKNEFEQLGLNANICQINTSLTLKKGTLRGMHYQVDPFQECKIIRCIRGSIFDVIVDLRPDSCTYLQWIGNVLDADRYWMVYIPENFAHGFITLEDNCEVYYAVTQFYTPLAERGIRWDDPAIHIRWPVEVKLVSEKDRNHPDFLQTNFRLSAG